MKSVKEKLRSKHQSSTCALSKRIEARTEWEPNTGCAIWTGCSTVGYGRININGQLFLVHRVCYFLANGMSPYTEDGLVLHKCDNRSCINPSHLYIGDHRNNGIDMRNRRRHPSYSKNKCKHGHTMDSSNVRVYRGARHCKKCAVIRVTEYNRRKRNEKINSPIFTA